jgi:acyl carrier protein
MATVALVHEICEIYREVLRVDEFGIDDDLPDKAVESMQVIKIAMAVHERLGVEAPLEIFLAGRTPRAVAEAIESLEGSAPL